MSKKPHKVEEAAKSNAGSEAKQVAVQIPPGDFKPRYVDDATFKKAMDEVFRVHGNVLRRLAEYDRNG